MKIAFFETKKWEEAYLKKQLKGHTCIFFDSELSEDHLSKIKTVDTISVFIYSHVTKKILNALPKLKRIVTRSTGFDHIDIDHAKKKKIKVCNVPFYGENTVAEHTFALILSLSRNIHRSYVRTLRDNFSIDGLSGFDLKGKTIGIIGGGHIGMHVARMAKGFGMNVCVFDLHKQSFLSEVLGFEYCDLEDILKNADIISLHVPYNKHTHHIIDEKKLSLMKKGSILINTSRGGLVDTDALYRALSKKKLGGAGLDVIEGEELIHEENQLLHDEQNPQKWKTLVRDHKIFQMDNVVFTPHNAFNSREALLRILDTTITNIKSEGEKNQVA